MIRHRLRPGTPWGVNDWLMFFGRRTPFVYPRYRLVLFLSAAVTHHGFGAVLAPAQLLRKHQWGIRMNVDEEAVRQLAQLIWETEGKPEGQEARHWEMATRLAESAAMAPARTAHRHKVETLFPAPDDGKQSD